MEPRRDCRGFPLPMLTELPYATSCEGSMLALTALLSFASAPSVSGYQVAQSTHNRPQDPDCSLPFETIVTL